MCKPATGRVAVQPAHDVGLHHLLIARHCRDLFAATFPASGPDATRGDDRRIRISRIAAHLGGWRVDEGVVGHGGFTVTGLAPIKGLP